MQSCQPLRFGRSLLRLRALRYAATLMIISLCSPSEKQKLFIFDLMRSCGHQIRQQPVVRVPFCVWGVGCATANRRSRFNHLTNHSVQFKIRFYASSWRGDFCFQSFQIAISKWEAESELLGDGSRQKTAHQNFLEEYYTEQFLCIVRSTQSTKHVKCSACFFSSWDFSVAHGRMYDVDPRVNLKRHINKGKAIGSTLKISH